MQNVSCPSCGAPVQFRSHASVMAVCEYCKASILKDADSVQNLGTMSDVLEDYSPIQIGTTGVFGALGFTVIGRIQLQYSAGTWNEWYLLFDDGLVAWLGDSSGLFTLTTEKTGGKNLPKFSDILPSQNYRIGGKNFIAAEVRSARCIAGQGELPFRVGQGWPIKVADFRSEASFLSLDYSDLIVATTDPNSITPTASLEIGEPKVYSGQAVSLTQLKCQLLRDDDAIKESAGKFPGKLTPLECPSCGSAVNYVPGLTSHLRCPSCQSQLDTTGPTAQVLAAGNRMARVDTSLELGAKAVVSGKPYQIIGLMKRCDDENTEWTEYLLYNASAGFFWLIETDEGWARAKVLSEWPAWTQSDTATLGNQSYKKLYDYTARVIFAAGAFNWRVNLGDRINVTEFQFGQNKIAAEVNAQEMTWSLASPVSADQIQAWFGNKIPAHKESLEPTPKSIARKFIIWTLVINAIPLFMAFGDIWIWVLLAVAAIYYPAKFLSPLSDYEV